MIIRQESVDATKALKDLASTSPLPSANLVLVFGSVKRFTEGKLQAFLKVRYPAAQLVGCTTSGEISPSGVFDDSIQITAIQWEKTIQRVAQTKMTGMQNSFEAAAGLAKQLKADTLRTVLVISDGLNVNGSELLKGFQSVLGDVPIVGGLAGDGGAFVKPATFQKLYGSDSDLRAVRIAKQNLEAAGLLDVVQLSQVNITEVMPPSDSGVLVANPPYGVRIGEDEELAALYPKMGEALKRKFAGWNTYFLTNDLRLPKLMRLTPSKRTPLFNGPLECRLFEIKMVAGSNRK